MDFHQEIREEKDVERERERGREAIKRSNEFGAMAKDLRRFLGIYMGGILIWANRFECADREPEPSITRFCTVEMPWSKELPLDCICWSDENAHAFFLLTCVFRFRAWLSLSLRFKVQVFLFVFLFLVNLRWYCYIEFQNCYLHLCEGEVGIFFLSELWRKLNFINKLIEYSLINIHTNTIFNQFDQISSLFYYKLQSSLKERKTCFLKTTNN